MTGWMRTKAGNRVGTRSAPTRSGILRAAHDRSGPSRQTRGLAVQEIHFPGIGSRSGLAARVSSVSRSLLRFRPRAQTREVLSDSRSFSGFTHAPWLVRWTNSSAASQSRGRGWRRPVTAFGAGGEHDGRDSAMSSSDVEMIMSPLSDDFAVVQYHQGTAIRWRSSRIFPCFLRLSDKA